MTASAISVEAEAELRRLVRSRRGMGAFAYRMLSGAEQFWPGSAAISLAIVEDLDAPRQCEAVAISASQQFGLGVAHGFVLIHGQAVQHYWNTNSAGEPVDGALRRRRPDGYLGKALSEREIEGISRFAFLSST